jgi:hypothetical protein
MGFSAGTIEIDMTQRLSIHPHFNHDMFTRTSRPNAQLHLRHDRLLWATSLIVRIDPG